jgi:hypothetical protein
MCESSVFLDETYVKAGKEWKVLRLSIDEEGAGDWPE